MTQAVILAAGTGSRCKPLTDDVPKCLLEFAGHTLLEHQQHAIQKNHITDLIVVTGYKMHEIKQRGYTCVFNSKFLQSNMVYSLFCAEQLFNNQSDLVVAYGDIIYQDNNLKKLLQTNGDVVVMSDLDWHAYWSLRFTDVYSDAESFVVDENNRVAALGQAITDHKNVQGQFTGLIKISADVKAELAEIYKNLLTKNNYSAKVMNMFMTEFIQYLIDAGFQVTAAEVHRGWLEFDSAQDMQLYENMLANQRLKSHFEVMS